METQKSGYEFNENGDACLDQDECLLGLLLTGRKTKFLSFLRFIDEHNVPGNFKESMIVIK